MSYIVTDFRGLGTIGAAAAGATAGGDAGGDAGGGLDVGGLVTGIGGALTSAIGGAINLANNFGLWRQQRRDAAGQREDAWAAELDSINQGSLKTQMSAEEMAAQNAVIVEQNRMLSEQERIMGHERSALEYEMRRGEVQAGQQARTAEAMRFRMPTWGWYALAGVGVAAVIGAGALYGVKSEES